MPGGGSKPGERRGGRAAGTPNKNTEREALIERAAEEAAAEHGQSKDVIADAVRKVINARRSPRDDGVEALGIIKGFVARYVEACMKTPMPGEKDHPAELWATTQTWLNLYFHGCVRIADFFDPRYRAVLLASGQLGEGAPAFPVIEGIAIGVDGEDKRARAERAQQAYLRLVKG